MSKPGGDVGIVTRALYARLDALHVPRPVEEYRFYPSRRWRFDYCWLEPMVALEVNGGVWAGGRHTRGAGYIRDMEKLNRAQLEGWVVLQATPQQVLSGDVFVWLCEALC